jgi:hypothetical protein
LLVLGFALVVHAVYVLETNRRAAFALPVIDAATYHRSASRALSDAPAPRTPFWQPPGC